MSVAFLYPMLWLGALAVAAPLWLHLRRRVDHDVFRFAALRFLDDEPIPRHAPLRLRDLLLFLFRMLAVLCLVAAFAWPFVEMPPAAAVRESRVYVLDNTLSHRANGRVLHDRDRIVRDLAAANRETQIAVIELTTQPRLIVRFSDSATAAVERVRAIGSTQQRGSYLAAFKQASALLEQSLGERKRIIWLGDNQQNQWQESANLPPFLDAMDVELPEVPADGTNVAVSNPRVRRTIVGDRAFVELEFTIHRCGNITSAEIALDVNGKTTGRRTIDLTDQPDAITLGWEWESTRDVPRVNESDDGWERGVVRITAAGDALSADDSAYFALGPVREGRVLLLAESPFLRTALSPAVMQGRWAAHVVDPTLAVATDLADRADVVCVEAGYLASDAARSLVTQCLSRGVGVLLLVDRMTPAVSGFLRERGFEVQTPTAATPTGFRHVFNEHPIFQPFLTPDFGNLLDVKLLQYRRLQASRAVPLVFTESGDAVFFEATGNRGKLFVAAFGLNRQDTNWPLQPTFVPFLDLCLQAARAQQDVPAAFEPGELAVWSLPTDSTARSLAISRDGRELLRVPIANRRVQFAMPAETGLYDVTFDADPTVQYILAANPSPLESRLTYIDPRQQVGDWTIPIDPSRKAAESQIAAELTLTNILRQQVWWWLLIAAIVALALESSVLARKATR